MLHLLHVILLMAFPVAVIVAGLSDVVSFKIPNSISISLGGAFFLAAVVAGIPLSAVGFQVAIGMIALLLGIGMFAAGWIGGGDAKLFAAAALWLGWPALSTFLLVTALAGGGLAVLLINLRRDTVRPFVLGGGQWVERLAQPGGAAPYGVAIAIGALAAFPESSLATALAAI